MRRKIFAVGLAAALWTSVTAIPGAAHEGHASCKAFGQTVSQNAQAERPWGQIVSGASQRGLTPVLIAESHTIEGLCEQKA